MDRRALLLLAASLIATSACAQGMPPASVPLSPSNVVPVVQSGGYKAATTLEIAQTLLSQTNTFGAYQVVNVSNHGAFSPRIGVAYQAVGSLANSENNLFDGFSINGWTQYVAERYDADGMGNILPVQAWEVVGLFAAAALDGSGGPGTGDPLDSAVEYVATENQTSTHNGMSLYLDYTPNASTALTLGLAVSPQGAGGVTVGGTRGNGSAYSGPSDLGPGTINTSDSIATANHFRSTGSAPTVSSCGSSPSITGTDVAGIVGVGGNTACTITFAKAYASSPICIVQTQNNASPVTFVASESTTALTVNFSSSLNGGWAYICQGRS